MPGKSLPRRTLGRGIGKQFSCLLEKFRSTPDGDGTLLDDPMIPYGSGLNDGNPHDHASLPMVLARRGCGAWKPGRSVKYSSAPLGDSNGEPGYLSEI